MADFSTNNPFSGEELTKYYLHTEEQLQICLQNAAAVFPVWSRTAVAHRASLLTNLSSLLYKRSETLAQFITKEMGKPIEQSRSEINKCIWACDFYAKNAVLFLSDALIETDANESFISYDALGTILGIMPWNYPFWQVFRFAAPTVTAGNTVLLKHAENVTGCALAIEQLFHDAGYPKGCFQVILADHGRIETLLGHELVSAVSLTGSEKAGRAVGQIAGKHLKKAVLELGGNNACIVFEDADLDTYIDVMVKARMQNNGQSCIAAKRFIVVDSIYDLFLERFEKKIKSLKVGNPMKDGTYLSVLAKPSLVQKLHEQVQESIKMGAQLRTGGAYNDTSYEPTILTNVTSDMPVFREETFGPVAAIIKASNRDEALALAVDSDYGLGISIFTQDTSMAKGLIGKIPDGAVFINDMVKSDVRLPFGGTKNSGFGRELSREGMLAFTNKKTVSINH